MPLISQSEYANRRAAVDDVYRKLGIEIPASTASSSKRLRHIAGNGGVWFSSQLLD